MPVLSRDQLRAHLDFLPPYMSDAITTLPAPEHRLRFPSTLPDVKALIDEAKRDHADDVAEDHAVIVTAEVDELLRHILPKNWVYAHRASCSGHSRSTSGASFLRLGLGDGAV